VTYRSDVILEDGIYGRRAVLHGGWDASLTEYLIRAGVVELVLNQAKGWQGNNLSFLAGLPDLKLFEIFDFNIKDITPIHSLCGLRRLGITTYCSTEIRFSAFSNLQSCALEWRPKATSLFRCRTLKELFVNRYDGKDLIPFSKLTDLESLAILNAPVSNLRGLDGLKKLRLLRLANLKRLSSLAGVEGLGQLEELEVHTCRGIRSIDEVGSLPQLRKLHLNNDGVIESLKPLDRLSCLESVLFYESTNILDGDLSPVFHQKNLRRVSFRNRRHYSHRREEFGTAYTR